MGHNLLCCVLHATPQTHLLQDLAADRVTKQPAGKGLLGCGIAAHEDQGRLGDSARDVIKSLGVRKTELTLLAPQSVCVCGGGSSLGGPCIAVRHKLAP